MKSKKEQPWALNYSLVTKKISGLQTVYLETNAYIYSISQILDMEIVSRALPRYLQILKGFFLFFLYILWWESW